MQSEASGTERPAKECANKPIPTPKPLGLYEDSSSGWFGKRPAREKEAIVIVVVLLFV